MRSSAQLGATTQAHFAEVQAADCCGLQHVRAGAGSRRSGRGRVTLFRPGLRGSGRAGGGELSAAGQEREAD